MNEGFILITIGSIYSLGVIGLTFYCWLVRWLEQRHLKQRERLLEHLMALLASHEIREAKITCKRDDLRSALIAVSRIASGPMMDQVRAIYVELGFFKEDCRFLRHRHRKSLIIRTLVRIRLLQVDLPKELWVKLIQAKSIAVRWLAMEAFILVKGKSALSTLVRYVQKPENERLGVLIHLFSLYASTQTYGLLVILDSTTTSDLVKLALLTTLRYYPHPDSETSILQVIGSSSNADIQRCGIEALKPFASEQVVSVLDEFSKNPSSPIREAVAFALHGTTSALGLEILERFTIDASHRVRRQAIESLYSIAPQPEQIFAAIRAELGHPAFELVTIRDRAAWKGA